MVADLKGLWSRLDNVRTVVAGASISIPEVKRCLLALQSSFRSVGQPPRPWLTHRGSETKRRCGDKLGVSTYLSAKADPRTIAPCLLEQVSPGLSLADTIVTRELVGAGSIINQLLDSARARGQVDTAVLD